MSKTAKKSKFETVQWIWVIAFFTVINAFLVLFVLGFATKELSGDELQYNQLTVNLLEHSVFSFETEPPFEPTVYRTPGYTFFLALVYLISGNSILLVKIIQFLLFGLSAYFIYHLAKFYTDEKTARIASFFALIYFPLIFLSAYLITETVSICLLIGLFLLIKKYDWQNNARIWLDLLLGIVMGVLAMMRPTTSLIVIPLILSLWIPYFFKTSSFSFKKVFAKSFVFGFGILLIFAPWIIRNATITNRFIPLTVGTSPESLYVSLLQYNGKLSYAFTLPEWKSIYLAGLAKRRSEAKDLISKGNLPTNIASLPKSVQQEMLIEVSYQESVNEELKELSLLKVIKSLPIRLAYLWSTADFAPEGNAHRLGQIQFVAFFALAIIGLLVSWKNLFNHWLILLFPVYLTLMHCIFHTEPRYTIPARPFILIYCAIGLVWLWNYFKKFRKTDELQTPNTI